ncbi:unannotated protein [freshwater metagenome]|uniref:Unannotated protein n=1 Tax=freshwater metagenome TaxID=449393 RepID=A0A6J6GCN1_9ZZZZ|nr:hypothetical protein [Actinomycetota bacterium]
MKHKLTLNLVVLGLFFLAACSNSPSESSNRERNATITTTAGTTTTSISSNAVAAQCTPTIQASVLTTCSSFTDFSYIWLDATNYLSSLAGAGVASTTKFDFKKLNPVAGATRVMVWITFTDGSRISKAMFPLGTTTKETAITSTATTTTTSTTTTTTLPGCKISIASSGLVTACKAFSSFTYSFWNDVTQISGAITGWNKTPLNVFRIPGSRSATRIQLTLKFSDGKSYTNFFVPYTNAKDSSIILR